MRPIDADALICSFDGSECLDTVRDYEEVEKRIEEAETLDVQEAKHGKWVHENKPLHCSKCGYEPRYSHYNDGKYSNANFCPNCGANMRN